MTAESHDCEDASRTDGPKSEIKSESDVEHESTQEAHSEQQRECNETVDPETRRKVLVAYEYRCQACGRQSPKKGGLATLHVHHIERDPDGMDEHDPENLTLLCRSCHSWFHQQSTPNDSPVEITAEDQSVLLPQDIEILRFLAENGPATTGEVADALTADLSVMAVRERLWVLMGLDNLVEGREQQVVDQDRTTGEWGLVGHIETSARGYIPDDPNLLLQRMEDEYVRQALERGCDRETVADVLGVTCRTTFYKEKRSNAYDFPLDAFDGRGGRPPEPTSKHSSADDGREDGSDADQQRLDAVAKEVSEAVSEPDTPTTPETDEDTDARFGDANQRGGEQRDVEVGEMRARLHEAIGALQEVHTALEKE